MKAYAGFWQRLKAFAFDYIVISLYLIGLTLITLLTRAVTDVGQSVFAERVTAQVSGFLLVTLPITLYFVRGESSAQRATWGKQRAGLIVEDRNGDRVGFWRALTRTLLKFIPWELSHTLIWELYFSTGLNPAVINSGFVLVYGLIGLNIASLVMSKSKQTLYDLLAGTYVVKRG